MRKAAICIGSNSTRLLAYNACGAALRAREETRLMLGLTPDGTLTNDVMESTARAVNSLKQRALAFGAQSVRLYATSATRDAKNAQAFSDKLEKTAGLRPIIVPGEMEAQLAFCAASLGRECAVIDIGGGSTELTYGKDNRVLCLASAQAGASRMFKERPIETLADAQMVYARVYALLERTYADILTHQKPPIFLGIGGTCATAAAIKLKTPSHSEGLEGTVLSKTDIDDMLTMLAPLSLEERALVRGLNASRTPIMPHGLCILKAAMALLDYEEITVSVLNNLDALIRLPD